MAKKTRPGWHPEDIKAAVRKRGVTLSALALKAGLSESACRLALIKPTFRAEQAIVQFLGVPAVKLWPDRYDPDGTPRHPRAPGEHRTQNASRRQRQKSEAA